MKLRILALILLAVLLAAPFATGVNAESDDGIGELKQDDDQFYGSAGSGQYISQEVYESIKGAAEERRDQAFSMLEKNVPASALNSLKEALDAMDEAEGLEAQDTQASAHLYIQALKLFRNAWNHLEDDDADLELFLEASERPSPGGEPSPVDELEPDLEEDIKETKQKLLYRFQVNFQERVNFMYSHVEDLENTLSSGDSVKAKMALTKVQERLLTVQGMLLSGECDEALDDLEVASQELEEGFESLDDDDASEMFKNLDELEAKIQTIKNKRSSDDEPGDDAAINELKAKIQKNKNELIEKKGKSEDNGKPNNKWKSEDNDSNENRDNRRNNGNSGNSANNGNNGNGNNEDDEESEDNGNGANNGNSGNNGNNGNSNKDG